MFHDLDKSLTANVLAPQDVGDCVMANARNAFELANSSLENLLLDFVARRYLFRAFVLHGPKLNKTQVFALVPIFGRFPFPRIDVNQLQRNIVATILAFRACKHFHQGPKTSLLDVLCKGTARVRRCAGLPCRA